MDSQEKRKLQYKKEYLPESKFATGVYGGITLAGQISMHFYIDQLALPEIAEFDANGREIPSENKEAGIIGTREFVASILIDPAMAKNFHEWLGNHLKTFEQTVAVQASN